MTPQDAELEMLYLDSRSDYAALEAYNGLMASRISNRASSSAARFSKSCAIRSLRCGKIIKLRQLLSNALKLGV